MRDDQTGRNRMQGPSDARHEMTDPSRRQVLRGAGLLLAGSAALALSGCASTGPSALYELTATPEVPATRKRAVQVLVARPRALKALDTDRIAVLENGLQISYFPDAAWTDALPNVLQSKIAEALQDTGALRGVGFPGDGLLIDYQLQTDIRTFALTTEGADRAVVELAARLLDDRNGRSVATQVFRAEVASSGLTAEQAVSALNRANGQVLAALTAWVIGTV